MKVFISVPMRGRTDEEILDDIEDAKCKLAMANSENDEPIYYVDNFVKTAFEAGIKNYSIWCLGRAIQKMSECDAIYFCPGWKKARGCLIERQVAIEYGLMCLYQDETGIIFDVVL